MTYTVALDNFSGPLDLLLHLVKQEEVEINEIPLSVICAKYLDAIRELQELDVDVAGEFLVMASTLMLIKSRTLLPIEDEVDLEEELNPEDELIQQLLEYKRFKMASRDLKDLAAERSLIYPFRPPKQPAQEREFDLEDLDVIDLCKAFAVILRDTGFTRGPRLVETEKPLREFIDDVFKILLTKRTVPFSGLFEDAKDKETVIGRFLALLELARRGRIAAVQLGSYDEIDITLKDDRELSLSDFDEIEADADSAFDEEREMVEHALNEAGVTEPPETESPPPALEATHDRAPDDDSGDNDEQQEMEIERWSET